MRLNRFPVAGAALVLALTVGGHPAEAGQRDSHGRDRNGRASQGRQGQNQNQNQGQPRESNPQQESVTPAPRPQGAPAQNVPAPAPGNSAQRRYAAPAVRGNAPYNAPSYGARGYNDHGGYYNAYPYRPYRYGYPAYGYYAPRPYVPAYYPPHYYGPGGHFSVYFGWGNGYLYGAPWTGPVYGYAAPAVSGRQVYYGDVRLIVQPRNAEVYVDGYYAGIVDDFDGTFQRLTIEAGPHHIELAAQGAEPRFFDVYVDPSRSVDIHADLFR